MTQILAFSGKKGSGKNTLCNFLHGYQLKSFGIIDYFEITDEGELVIETLVRDEQGKEKMSKDLKWAGIEKKDYEWVGIEDRCRQDLWTKLMEKIYDQRERDGKTKRWKDKNMERQTVTLMDI